MALSALASLERGLRSVCANWPLLLVHGLGTMVALALLLTGLLVMPLILGFASGGLPTSFAEWSELPWSSLFELPWASWAAGALATVATWIAAAVLFCFFQAGTHGVLLAADRQARVGASDHRLFRTYSWRDLCGWGVRDWRRYSALLLVFSLVEVGLGVALGTLLVVALASGATWGGAAGIGIGGGGFVPLAFLFTIAALWLPVAQVLLARSEFGVGTAAKLGLRLVSRRLGAVFWLCVVGLGAVAAVSLVLALLAVGLTALTDWESPLLLQVSAAAAQWGFATFVGLVLAASLVAMARAEQLEVPAR